MLFAPENSVVRKVWSQRDTTLFVFAGASAEFALNKAVDWLYFTGRLPSDPLGRLLSTVAYARKIVFATEEDANRAIDSIRAIHGQVEANRGHAIPAWAYRDVLFMLIYYSIRSHELLEGAMTEEQKEELYQVFYKMGIRMQLEDLPVNYSAWLPVREQHLRDNLECSKLTVDLFGQYRKHLGSWRYWLLREVQKKTCPPLVRRLLSMSSISIATPLLALYRPLRHTGLDNRAQEMLLPKKYRDKL